jgi:hypothetical protein
MSGAPPRETSTGKSAFLSISGSLLAVAGPSVSLSLLGNTLMARDAVDGRFKLLALLVILGVALAGIVPDFDLLPAASRLAHRVRTLTLIAHLPNPSPLRHTAPADGLQPASSNSASGNCIIDLTCSRLLPPLLDRSLPINSAVRQRNQTDAVPRILGGGK